MNPELGFPSGLGALWGLNWVIARLTCVFVIVEKENFRGGYSSFTSICSSIPGAEKNVFMKVLDFSSFDVVVIADSASHTPRLSVGTRALHLSVGGPDVYWCAVQMVLSSTDCRKSSQWVLLAFHISFSLFCRFCGLAHLVCFAGHRRFFLVFVLPFVSVTVLLTTISL